MTDESEDGIGVRGRLWRSLPAVLVFAATSIVFVWPALSSGGTFAATDILGSASPYREALTSGQEVGNPLQSDQMVQLPLVAEFWDGVRKGRLQLWEPDQAGGVPLFTGVHNRVLTPWFVTFLFLPAALAPTVAVAIGLFVGQLGTYGLARRLGLSRPAATFAGVAYVLSGPVTALVLRIHEALLLPAVLWAVHGALTSVRRGGRFLVAASLVTAATWLCGFPAAALFNLYAATAFAAVLAWQATGVGDGPPPGARQILRRGLDRARHTVRRAVPVGIALAAGTAIAAVQLLPTLEFLRTAVGAGRTLPLWHAAGIAKLSTAVSGRFFGTYQYRDWWWPQVGYSNPVEASATAGLVVLGLLVLVVAGLRARRAPWTGSGSGASADEDTTPARLARADRLLATFFLPLGLVVLVGVFLGGIVLGAIHVLPFMAENSFGRARYVLSLVLALSAAYALDLVLDAWRRRHPSDPGTYPTAADPRPASTALRVQLALVLGAVGFGLYRGFAAASDAGVTGQALASLRVPGVVAAGAALVVLVIRRFTADVGWARPAATVGPARSVAWPRAVALVVTVAAATELMWGAWGFTPASPAALFYPDSPAFDVVEDEVGEGGAWRFMAKDPAVLPSHTAAYVDLKDIRAEFPVYGPYHDLLRAADPGLPADATKVVLVAHFSDRLSLDSPVLDATSARYHITPLTAEPLEAGRGRHTDLGAVPGAAGTVRRRLPATVTLPVPQRGIRAVRASIRPIDCDDGTVTMTVAGVDSTRLLRDVDDSLYFHLPDLTLPPGTVEARLSTDGCRAEIADPKMTVVPPAPDGTLEVVTTRGWVVYRRPHARPRVELAGLTVRIVDGQKRLETITDRVPGRGAVVVSGEGAESGRFGGGSVRIVEDEPDRVVVDVTADGRGLLVLRDVNAPGWHADVDGRGARILTADHAFRAVRVPSGRSTVTFTYRPRTLVIGAWTASAGMLITVALAAWARRRRLREE